MPIPSVWSHYSAINTETPTDLCLLISELLLSTVLSHPTRSFLCIINGERTSLSVMQYLMHDQKLTWDFLVYSSAVLQRAFILICQTV